MTLDQAFEQLKTLAEHEIRKSGYKVAGDLHQAVRRLRQAKNEGEIAGLLINFPQEGRSVCLTFEGESAKVNPYVAFPIHDSPALVSAIESRDTVVTAASARELSDPLFQELDSEGRVHLIPIAVHGAVKIVLVSADAVDSTALETLCETAGLRLESLASETVKRKPEGKWEDLPEAEQAEHLRAQRFAQVAVARMRVEQNAAVREGQQRGDLYAVLRQPIDRARTEYKEQFLSGQSKTMVDYLYVELVRSLANDEDRLLGAGFPGRLI